MKSKYTPVVVAAMIMLAGCSSPDDTGKSPNTPATEVSTGVPTSDSPESAPSQDSEANSPGQHSQASASDEFSLAPSTETQPVERTYEIQCGGHVDPTPVFTDVQDLWDSVDDENREDCEVNFADGNFDNYKPSEQELHSLDVANENTNAAGLSRLYERCAEYEMGGLHTDGHWFPSDKTLAQGAFELCPDHPERKSIEDTFGQIEADNSDLIERDEAMKRGDYADPGTHRVGREMKPGVWVAESDDGFDSCYWELLDENGNIIDNNHAVSALRVEVTVPSSAYSFHSTGCTGWIRE